LISLVVRVPSLRQGWNQFFVLSVIRTVVESARKRLDKSRFSQRRLTDDSFAGHHKRTSKTMRLDLWYGLLQNREVSGQSFTRRSGIPCSLPNNIAGCTLNSAGIVSYPNICRIFVRHTTFSQGRYHRFKNLMRLTEGIAVLFSVLSSVFLLRAAVTGLAINVLQACRPPTPWSRRQAQSLVRASAVQLIRRKP
jgi:hypothetical protein